MDGYVTIGTKLDTSGIDSDLSSLQRSLEKRTDNMANTINKTFKLLKTSIIGLGIGYVLKSISKEMDSVISRVDTLNNFPKVMANLGISSEDAQKSVNYLSEKLKGLPTSLDSAVSSVQRFASANGDVKASTTMFLALNNAILAGNAPMQQQANALEQLSQAYAKGKPDMMEWRTMMSTMPAQLKQVSIAMGYASSSELGDALRSGAVSMNDFMATLVKLNKQGINGFASFEQQASTSTGGIRTSITNLKTTIVRAMSNIVDAIGRSNIAGFFNGIAKAIDNVTPYVVAFVKVIMTMISILGRLFGQKVKTDSKEFSTNISEAGSSMDNLDSGVEDVTDGLGGAVKKAKELNKQIAGFDEMNVLQDNKSDTGGSGGTVSGGASVGGIDLSAFDFELESVNSKVDEIYNKLMDKFGKIGKFLKDIWDSEPIQAFVNTVEIYGGFLWDYWSTLGTNLWDNMKTTWGNISDNVGITLDNIKVLWTMFWTDLGTGIETWGQPIIDDITGLFNSIWADAIDPSLQIITQAWADFSGTLVKLWDEYGEPLINNIGEFADTTIKLFQKIWDDVLEPIITPFLETLSWLWDEHLKGLVENLGEFILKLVNGAMEIWNKFFAPLISDLIDKLAPAWAFVDNFVIGVLGTIIGAIVDFVSWHLKLLGGIIDFITGVFTGNWEKAWNGVKSILENIARGFEFAVKLPINLIIDIINSFIAGLNKMKVPDWVPVVGGQGVNIPKIPKLAKGGIVNMPGKGVPVGGALTGEVAREGVIPLTDSQQMEILGEAIGKYITVNANIVNNMNGKVLSRELHKIQNEEDFAFNR